MLILIAVAARRSMISDDLAYASVRDEHLLDPMDGAARVDGGAACRVRAHRTGADRVMVRADTASLERENRVRALLELRDQPSAVAFLRVRRFGLASASTVSSTTGAAATAAFPRFS